MSNFWAELLGTAMLIVLGNGVVANVLLAKTKGNGSGWIVIAFGWGMAVFVAAFCVDQYSGALPQSRIDDWPGGSRKVQSPSCADISACTNDRGHGRGSDCVRVLQRALQDHGRSPRSSWPASARRPISGAFPLLSFAKPSAPLCLFSHLLGPQADHRVSDACRFRSG